MTEERSMSGTVGGGRVLGYGALAGLLLTIPLVAIFWLADAFLGTPFVPFDVLDWAARNMPGGLITFAIDTMVSIITALQLGETSTAAKAAEQLMGIAGMVISGVVVGAVFYHLARRRSAKRLSFQAGLIPGLVLGLPVALLSNDVNFSALTAPLVNFLWIVVGFAAWGLALATMYNRLLASPEPVEEPAAEASVETLDRRSFLVRMGGAAATITVVGAGVGSLLRESGGSATTVRYASSSGGVLPNADASVQPVDGTRPELTPVEKHYRIDISSRPPVLEEETWTLPVTGMVDNPLDLTLADLRSDFRPMDQYLTLSCISNRIGGDLIGTQKWTGFSLQDLLTRAKVQEGAQYLRIFGGDGFHETVDIDLINEDQRIMLAYAWDDQPLPERNGFPLRIYIPDRYGMKQPKWITGIEVVEDYEQGYWVTRGWDEEALMQTTSVIDVVATDQAFMSEGMTFIPVGGIAHAGDRSISKVEVRMDEGDWQEAQLRDPLSDKTWVLWRFDMPFSEGRHRIEVRSVDGEGEPQIESVRGTRPSGATGVHGRNVDLVLEAEAGSEA
ncbi:MAG: molybdopterin-dependent oxidoreductase [Anaerolineaceae bacterium]|nr:molybdopterin-dependent oxidoreductase [Anaerolineaceae bacterium]